jgi:catechol 2,3-dioxygenase-like lactoylglutathione lyase family enzyme
MEKFIAKLVKDFEDRKVSRRQLILTLNAAAATLAAGEQAANAAPPSGFKTIAVNHISYNCPDYTIARDFYQHLMGMSVVGDSGRQCLMPFGNAGTHFLPRGYPAAPSNYTPSGTVAPLPQQRGNRGGGGAGAAGGRGPAAAQGQAAQPKNEVVINHIAYTCTNWNKARVKSILEAWGLYPTEDGDSFHVQDPFGYNLQISGPGMTPFPDTTTKANGGGE